MSGTTTVPITLRPEAAARVQQLQLPRELARILEHTSRAVPGIRSIEVVLAPPCDPGDDPRLVLEVTRDDPDGADDPTWREWRDWMVDTFPSEVLRHFNLLTVYGAADEG